MSKTKKTQCNHEREILMLIDIREHVLSLLNALRTFKKLPSFHMEPIRAKKIMKTCSKLLTRIQVIDHQIHALDCLCKEKCKEVKPVDNKAVKSLI